ncbi:acyl carrier protein [Kibdelosporangium banguiense]|uniref:Acyl carrier protein n=1 Tax=Kibdelosporangium banguiense TaxID=1365924 RepID=A0ABS4TWA3_9PSEU|nr:acyl carrier protein [Kibdelosporangium banguiense]MBP2328677.1 acyl carrier protein [Kibdelosporangium banguiense]
MSVESREVVVGSLTRYIESHLLDGDSSIGLTVETPLLEWGVLNSIETARLVAHIRDEFGVRVPPAKMVSKHFSNIDRIADLVCSLGQNEA